MKIILRSDVDNLGKAGDTYEVSPGYFRNFLQPRGLAVEATKGLIKNRQALVSTAASKRARAKDQTQQLAEDLGEIMLTFPVKVGDQGRMYGSVTAKDIADELKKTKELDIDRHKIVLTEALRSPGEHSVVVKLDHGVEAQVKVDLVPESDEAG